MFVREDWTLFRNLTTIGQKAGVPQHMLAALVVKEITDNALDAGANVTINQNSDGWVLIEDDGPGLPDDEAFISNLFSIRRPLTSSKLIRLPSRGALGNGLRVVVGAVFASDGEMYIETGSHHYTICPQEDGTTSCRNNWKICPRKGTMVAVRLGRDVPPDDKVTRYAEAASFFASVGEKEYSGKTCPFWYDTPSFYELAQAAGKTPLADLLMLFRDISKTFANELANGSLCEEVSRDQAQQIMTRMRAQVKQCKPQVLGKIGPIGGEWSHSHKYESIVLENYGMAAELPYSIDAYVRINEDTELNANEDALTFMVNKTPVVSIFECHRKNSNKLAIFGAGLRHLFDVGKKPVQIICNITTPYMPVTTDGKEPDLYRYLNVLQEVLTKAARLAKKNSATEKVQSQKDLILNVLQDAVSKASGGGQYRYSLRQLFYAVRPYVIDAIGKEPEYNYFSNVITDVEAEIGNDLPGLYRDARGTIYHPHTGEIIPLGTLNVEKYNRPEWTFNKILYSEKEGFFELLKDTKWPERNDCALLTSKGFASRAARDVIDLIGSTQEEIYFFCIHDADASGTLIYESLTQATRARGMRKVHVINLGLDPEEAVEMQLQVEEFRTDVKRHLPVASYVSYKWKEWLQTKRVELNAMDSPMFLEWLDSKFTSYATKVVPPHTVLRDTLQQCTESSIRNRLAAKILQEAGFESKINNLMEKVEDRCSSINVTGVVQSGLKANPELRWDSTLTYQAEELAEEIIR